jgi:hypothetical protein
MINFVVPQLLLFVMPGGEKLCWRLFGWRLHHHGHLDSVSLEQLYCLAVLLGCITLQYCSAVMQDCARVRQAPEPDSRSSCSWLLYSHA